MTSSIQEEIRSKLYDTLMKQVDMIMPAIIKVYDALPSNMSDKEKIFTLSSMLSGAEQMASEQLNNTIDTLKEKINE